jgi:hypothetical protein
MADDTEKELASTPAIPEITREQRGYLESLLDSLDLDLDEAIRDCYVNGDFESNPDELESLLDSLDLDIDGDITVLSKREASVLIDYLKELRHER